MSIIQVSALGASFGHRVRGRTCGLHLLNAIMFMMCCTYIYIYILYDTALGFIINPMGVNTCEWHSCFATHHAESCSPMPLSKLVKRATNRHPKTTKLWSQASTPIRKQTTSQHVSQNFRRICLFQATLFLWDMRDPRKWGVLCSLRAQNRTPRCRPSSHPTPGPPPPCHRSNGPNRSEPNR